MKLIQLTPVYRSSLDPKESKRLKITLSRNLKWPHAFFGPESMNYSELQAVFPQSQIFKFPDKFFESTQSYSLLMLDTNFYERFSDFEALVITQLDSIVVKEIPSNLVEEFDYVGALWKRPFQIFAVGKRLFMTQNSIFRPISYEIWIGNGGLSLRNINATLDVLRRYHKPNRILRFIRPNKGLNEDVILSYLMCKYVKRLPPIEESKNLFLEFESENLKHVGNAIGFHALEKYNPELESQILSWIS